LITLVILGEKYKLRSTSLYNFLHHITSSVLQPPAHAGSSLVDFSTLKMEAIRYFETSADTRSTRRHIPEDGILQNSNCFAYLEHHLHFTTPTIEDDGNTAAKQCC
jgi:hypothetical protein